MHFPAQRLKSLSRLSLRTASLGLGYRTGVTGKAAPDRATGSFPRTQDPEDSSTCEVSTRKALLDLKVAGVCLARVAQGLLLGGRSHPGSEPVLSSQWGLSPWGYCGQGPS